MKDRTPDPDASRCIDVASKKEVVVPVLLSPDRYSTDAELALHNAKLASYLHVSRPILARRILACTADGLYYCRCLKLCAFCRVKRGNRLLKRRHVELSSLPASYHLTMTVPDTAKLKREAIDHVRRSFKKLRKTKMFRSAVRGGLVNLAADWTGEGWHVHLHMLLDSGQGPDESRLRAEWRSMTGGEQVVLQRVIRRTASNVFGYGTKLDNLPLNGKLLAEYLDAVKGIKLMAGWGTLYRVPKEITELTVSETL